MVEPGCLSNLRWLAGLTQLFYAVEVETEKNLTVHCLRMASGRHQSQDETSTVQAAVSAKFTDMEKIKGTAKHNLKDFFLRFYA